MYPHHRRTLCSKLMGVGSTCAFMNGKAPTINYLIILHVEGDNGQHQEENSEEYGSQHVHEAVAP